MKTTFFLKYGYMEHFTHWNSKKIQRSLQQNYWNI